MSKREGQIQNGARCSTQVVPRRIDSARRARAEHALASLEDEFHPRSNIHTRVAQDYNLFCQANHLSPTEGSRLYGFIKENDGLPSLRVVVLGPARGRPGPPERTPPSLFPLPRSGTPQCAAGGEQPSQLGYPSGYDCNSKGKVQSHIKSFIFHIAASVA